MKTLTFAEAHGRMVLLSGGATRPGATAVTGCPEHVNAALVCLKLQHVAFWPVPDAIDHDRLMAIPNGSFVRGDRP